MAARVGLTCLGSLTIAPTEAPPLGDPKWVGRCPECGAELELGYAGLLPVHSPAAVPGQPA